MANKVSCVLTEDELPAARILEMYIAKVDFLELKATFGSATQTLKYLNANQTDLLLLDINLPDISGINLIKALTNPPHVIFTSAYAGYAVESFDLEAVDYLLKPISFERFIKAINRFLKLKQRAEAITETPLLFKEKPFVFIKCDKTMVKIFLDDILYFEAQKNYIAIHTTKERYRTYHSVSDMEEKLPGQLFIRLHRSFIVAVDKITSYTHNYVKIGAASIPIGRVYHAAILTLLKNKPGIIKK